jgi:serine/threonine protein kinase
MAPEVVHGREYDGCCDWWSIGIILYECLYGATPFYDTSRDIIKRKIVAWQKYLRFPSRPRIQRPQSLRPIQLEDVRPLAIDLICRLIIDPQRRLSLEGIKSHEFFREERIFNWGRLMHTEPPFVPERFPGSIDQWFESEDKIGPMDDKYKRPRDKILRDPACGPIAMEIRKQTAFLGYTFRRSDLVCWLESMA